MPLLDVARRRAAVTELQDSAGVMFRRLESKASKGGRFLGKFGGPRGYFYMPYCNVEPENRAFKEGAK